MICRWLVVLVALAGIARADEAPNLLERSRLGAYQLHVNVLIGVEPVEGADAVAFGTSAEFLWHCRIGVFAGLLSSNGHAQRASGPDNIAPADRISVPFGVAWRPLGHLGLHAVDGARGWLQRFLAGIGLQIGVSVEHERTSDDSLTSPAFHAALTTDIPLWGGPVEGGVAIRLMGRLVAGRSASLDSGAAQMPAVNGQFYGGVAWEL